jgi:hypothetical protein
VQALRPPLNGMVRGAWFRLGVKVEMARRRSGFKPGTLSPTGKTGGFVVESLSRQRGSEKTFHRGEFNSKWEDRHFSSGEFNSPWRNVGEESRQKV